MSIVHCKFREVELETESESFDLHNDFDFAGCAYDVVARSVSLRWIPNEYASSNQRRSIVVEMRGVFHFSSSPRDPDVPFSEDTCLSSVGLIPPSAPMLDSAQSDAPPNWHHVFTFMSGFRLRIGAESLFVLPNDI
ncbi:MAG: hypothetical protein KIS67_16670 [Verrucomicrobiae bacterium]|mgnify:CR=1 FL=1|nr:hypothetical protein [Verrucomicrobiae bacterium]